MENLNKILEDLYSLDPELKKREKELINIINNLIKSKPNIIIDENFVSKLKNELLKIKAVSSHYIWQDIINKFMKLKLAYAAGGLAIVILAVFTTINLNNSTSLDLNLSEDSVITKSSSAFGSLTQNPEDGSVALLNGNQATPEAIGMGGGNAKAMSFSSDMTSSKMIMPPYYNKSYSYKYEGKKIGLENSTLPVYKKIKKVNTSDFASLIKNFNLGLADINKFSNLNIENINISEDKEFGYRIYLNFKEALISINQNWEKWPRPENKCGEIKDEDNNRKCYDALKLKINDVPSDEKIIEIANNFLKNYNIKMDNYGDPIIDNNWKISNERESNKNNIYIPETIQVTYPLIIDNQTVYEQSGNPGGLNVSINIRHNKVSGVHALSSLNLESSEYEVITDMDKIVKFAEKGGMMNYFYRYNDSTPEELLLDSPRLTLMKYNRYENNESTELYVPVLIFPIKNIPEEGYFYKKNILVPLEKEMFEEYSKNFEDDVNILRPMPLIEPMIMENTVINE